MSKDEMKQKRETVYEYSLEKMKSPHDRGMELILDLVLFIFKKFGRI